VLVLARVVGTGNRVESRCTRVQVDDCTFHPQINPKSRVTAETKRTDANLPVSERLYQASQCVLL
jgi:hypothetical protein